jgi:hypothetical protein
MAQEKVVLFSTRPRLETDGSGLFVEVFALWMRRLRALIGKSR